MKELAASHGHSRPVAHPFLPVSPFNVSPSSRNQSRSFLTILIPLQSPLNKRTDPRKAFELKRTSDFEF